MTNDGINQYAYDAEGRVCAVYSGVTEAFTGYIYDGLGRRIAKGTLDPMKVTLPLTAAACDITKNGFVTTNVYVPGSSGEQLDEGDAGTNLHNSNIYANGQLLATVTSDNNLHFALNDWLGTKRVVASASGTVEENCLSLPFGDELDCNGSDPSEQHFTGKERDSESGLDYFGARYYASSLGRFLSPDWSSRPNPVPYADLTNPQSLNLYGYAGNNPLSKTDPDGHCDIDGEHHNGLWCFAHALGITETEKEQAADAQAERQLIASKGLTLPNGHPLDADVLSHVSDKDILEFGTPTCWSAERPTV